MGLESDRLPRNAAIYYVKPVTLDHPGICKMKPQVESLPISEKVGYGRPLRSKRSR